MAGGKGGARGPMTRETQVSKKLSWLLRHGAEKEGLSLGQGGYISLKEVVSSVLLRVDLLRVEAIRPLFLSS